MHRTRRRALTGVLLALVVGLAPSRVAAQRTLGDGIARVIADGVSVRAWTVESGLPQSSVLELAVDRDGYVWGATFGGLFRFDGRSIIGLAAAQLPILSANSATALHATRNGDLWVGTPTGTIARLRNGRLMDSLPSLPRDRGSRIIDAIVADRRGRLWVREGEDVHVALGGRWSAPLSYRSFSTPVVDTAGAVLFVGADGFVRVPEVGPAQVRARPDTASVRGDLGVFIDPRGPVWIGQQRGVWLLDGEQLTRLPGVDGRVQAIVGDSVGVLWFGAERRLYRYRSPAATTDGATPELVLETSNNILSMALTHDGLLVVGTQDGMLVVRQNAATVVYNRGMFPEGNASSIAARGDGTVYVTSGCGPVRRMTGRGEYLDSIPRPVRPGCSNSVLVDRQRRVWIGGDGAIRRHNPAGGTDRLWTLEGTPAPRVRPLLAWGDTVLFGLSDGRVGRIFPDDRLEYLDGWSRPRDIPVQSLAIADGGVVWIAQSGMLTRWQKGRQAVFTRQQRIPNVTPRALLADGDDGVWIGTYGSGLWHLRVGRDARPVPLPDPTISALMVDDHDRLWMPGNKGLTVVSMVALRRWLADSSERPVARVLSVAEGVPEANSGSPAATRLAPGVLGFASVGGLVEVETTTLPLAGETPVLRIDSMQTGDGRSLSDTGTVHLETSDRGLIVGFSVPSFMFADATTFRYRLEGRDAGWQMLGAVRTVRLSSLRPGRYTLRIEGRVPGGNWQAAPSTVVEVPPTLLERRWVWVGLALTMLTVVAVAVVQRVRTINATARAREIELRARRDAAVLAEQHQRELAQVSRVAVAGELTASLSHELGQPLAAIVNNAEVARRLMARQVTQGSPANPAIEEALLDVVAQGRRASQVVREFRRFLRREHGEREQLAVREFVDSTTLLLRQEYADAGVPLHVDIAGGTPAITVERVLLQQVLVNLLQNALEAARGVRAGFVLVRARPVGNGVRISVVDNGSGFAADVRRSAFEPFVTTRASGMGMGLAIARRVVEAQGGRIAVGQLPGAGAVVSLWVPAEPVQGDRLDNLVPLQVTTHA